MIDVFLLPGEHYFGGPDTRVRTLLGSCVAVTAWHPGLRIGGMTHSLLPRRDDVASMSGKYIDEAIYLLIREAVLAGANPSQFEWKLFGGASMFAQTLAPLSLGIGERNSAAASNLLDTLGLTIAARDLGGDADRSLTFDIADGAVWVRYGDDREVAQRIEMRGA